MNIFSSHNSFFNTNTGKWFSPACDFLTAGYEDGSVILTDYYTGEQVFKTKVAGGHIISRAFAANMMGISMSDYDCLVDLYADIGSGLKTAA